MGTPQTIGASGENIQSIQNRLVWVLNLDPEYSYKAKWRNVEVQIPAALQKIPKRFEEGGNLFPYLEGHKFVVDLVEPQEWVMDSAGKPQPVFRNKMLKTVELTDKERAEISGETAADLKKQALAAERAAKRTMKKANDSVTKKVAVLAEDPDDL